MYRHADLDSLIYPLHELQNRVALEVSPDFVKEEGIRESSDQKTAKYSIVYYETANNESGGQKMDVSGTVRRLAADVLDDFDVAWDLHQTGRSRATEEIIVTVYWREEKDETRQAEMRRMCADAPLDVFPLTVYADQNVYNIATDGNEYFVLKNGKAVSDGVPSPAYALGSMVLALQEELVEIETASGTQSPPHDFLASLASAVVNTPDIPAEAMEHFVKYYELLTLEDFAAMVEEPENSE